MSPSYLLDHHHPPSSCSNPISPLKINRNSCYIKKSSTSSSLLNQQRHHPVIIYTHSPKIIHTHPRDFMALVQKLTGLSSNRQPNSDPNTNYHDYDGNDDGNESNSVIAGESYNSSCNTRDIIGVNSSSSCCSPPRRSTFDPPNTSANEDTDTQNFHNDFGDNLDFFPSAQEPHYNYIDPLFFMSTMETSITSSFESMKELPDF